MHSFSPFFLSLLLLLVIFRAGNSLIGFLSKLLDFCKKMSKWAIPSKNEQFAHLLIFGEGPERFAHGHSFLVSNLSESLMVAHFWWATWANHSWSLIFGEQPEQFAHQKRGNERIAHFLNNKMQFAHLSWGTWANHSRSLICHEWPERIAHGRSFVLSDLSKSLTVAHLIWAKWAMSKLANFQPCLWFEWIALKKRAILSQKINFLYVFCQFCTVISPFLCPRVNNN